MILKNGKRIDGCSDTVPIGTVNPFLGTVAPFGYLLLQGQRVSKTTYPELYEICGTTFGPETSTEFTLPDLRGQTIAGYKEGDATFGTLGGLIGALTTTTQNHTLTVNEIPTHRHGLIQTYNVPSGSGPGGIALSDFSGTTPSGLTGPAGGDAPHNHGDVSTIQPTITLNWIVKAVMLIPNQSTVVNNDSDSAINVYSCDFINDMLEQMKRETFDFAHPVGSYYETSDSTWTPQAAGWYGTWVADNDGSALVSYKSSGAFNKATGTIVGGESQTYTPAGKNTGTAVTMNAVELTHSGGAVGNHTLTVSEMPSHTHNVWYFDCNPILSPNNQGGGRAMDPQNNWLDSTGRLQNTGGGGAHNHGFTQPNKHSFTPTTKTVTQPTFTGTAASLSTIQTSKVVYRWHRTA